MKTALPLMLAVASIAATSQAEAAQIGSTQADVIATVETSIRAGLAGDVRTLREAYAPDCTFIDEFAPFFWTGPNAMQSYFASGYHMYQATGHKDDQTALSPTAFVYVSGDRAFVVEALKATATVRGKPYVVSGSYAFTLAKTGDRWKITSQTWTKSAENMDPYR